MPLFGAHFSTSGGVQNAITTAKALNCDTLQLFTKNAAHWSAPPLAEADIAAFPQGRRRILRPEVSHCA